MKKKELAQYIKEELVKDEVEIYLDIEDYEVIVKALEQEPILDRIRAEIADYDDLIRHNAQVQWCLKVIDKYKAESKTEQGLSYADQDTLMSAT